MANGPHHRAGQPLKRRPRDLFSEFQDIEPEATLGGGDVKYHLGYSCDREDRDGNAMHVSLAFNPSHLEAVDPVVVGRVRAKQRRHRDWVRRRILGILIHGDAPFAARARAETLQLSTCTVPDGGTCPLSSTTIASPPAAEAARASAPTCDDDPLHGSARQRRDWTRLRVARWHGVRAFHDVVIDLSLPKFGHHDGRAGLTQPLIYRRIRRRTIAPLRPPKLIEEGVTARASGVRPASARVQVSWAGGPAQRPVSPRSAA